MARVSKLRRHVAICRRGNILKTFLVNENGGVFSYDNNPHLPQNFKKQCSLFVCVCVFHGYSSEKTINSVTTQHFNNHAKKHTHKKNCQQPASSPRGKRKSFSHKSTHAYYASYLRTGRAIYTRKNKTRLTIIRACLI